MKSKFFCSLLRVGFCVFFLAACDDRSLCAKTAPEAEASVPPPAPPIREDFEGEPKLSLFPRVGDFRPEEGDTKKLPYWRIYIEHMLRVSGVKELPLPLTQHRVFTLHGIGGLESVGFFAPLAVHPGTEYRLSAWLRTQLPAGASAGIGFLEFDQFLWIDEQYSRSLAEKHQTGAREGIRLTGKKEGEFDVRFRTGPKTRMVHLVFFLEKAGREGVQIDDIRFERSDFAP